MWQVIWVGFRKSVTSLTRLKCNSDPSRSMVGWPLVSMVCGQQLFAFDVDGSHSELLHVQCMEDTLNVPPFVHTDLLPLLK